MAATTPHHGTRRPNMRPEVLTRHARKPPAAGNIDVLLAPDQPPISGGAGRMEMCSMNVNPLLYWVPPGDN